MSKKKPGRTRKATGGKHSTSRANGSGRKAAAARSRRRQPADQPLPGLEQARVRKLDDVFRSIGETRDAMADLRADEAGYETTALGLMRKHDLTSYRHAGVEMARVPGAEKLRIRTIKGTATAEAAEETERPDDDGAPDSREDAEA